jgi:chemotaxis protein histidine kinase CheA
MEKVGAALAAAVHADPQTGTPELGHAVAVLGAAVDGRPDPPPPDPDPPQDPVLPEAAPASEERAQGPADSNDLGGLLSTLDSWAFGETVRVNAASLFRLINAICSLRVDTEVLETLVLAAGGDAGAPDSDLIARLRDEVVRAGRDAGEVQRQALELAAAPMAEITNTFSQLVRYLARKTGKEVRFELVGDEIVADRQVLERLADPLRQLLVNAVHHGLETVEERQAAGKPRTGILALRMQLKDNKLELVVEDDGRGVDWAAVHRVAQQQGVLAADAPADPDRLRSILFSDGFGTGGSSDLVTGDGIGLASAIEAVEGLHGTFTFETEPGAGTRATIVVPVSRSLQDAVLVSAGGHQWGIPEIALLDRLPMAEVAVVRNGSRSTTVWRGEEIPVFSFAEAVGLTAGPPRGLLVVSGPNGRAGFTVDRILGSRQIAVRELGPLLDGVPHVTGAALLGGGDVVVLVDPGRLAEKAQEAASREGPRHRVLVVDDSLGVRQVVGGALGSAGFVVALAATADEALAYLADNEVDGIVLDYVLPEMDGVALVEVIRRRGVGVPIVMLPDCDAVRPRDPGGPGAGHRRRRRPLLRQGRRAQGRPGGCPEEPPGPGAGHRLTHPGPVAADSYTRPP